MNTANIAALRTIYADLTRITAYVDEDVVLHTAAGAELRGSDAVLASEVALMEATGGTLVMDVAHIVANDHFGAVLGVLRAGDAVAMPFCGLWRFRDGRVVEHWENAYDPAALARLLGARSGVS